MNLALATYRPFEAEEVTKVTSVNVRNWRRAGYLPRYKEVAPYTIANLLTMTAMQSMVERGVSPSAATVYASEVARALFQSLIWSEKAYTPAALLAAKADPCPEEVDRLQAEHPGLDAKTIIAAFSRRRWSQLLKRSRACLA